MPTPIEPHASAVSPSGVSADDLFKRLSLTHARRNVRELVAQAERESWSYHDFLFKLFTDEVAHRAQTVRGPHDREPPLDELLMRLNLASAPHVWRILVSQAEQGSWSHLEVLTKLLAEEVGFRQRQRLSRITNKAQFPFLKTIEQFDFNAYPSTLSPIVLDACRSTDFVTEGRCMVLSGKAGRGKTHLAIGIAHHAIQNGFEARYTTAREVIDHVSRASREGRTRAALPMYTHSDVLIIDDLAATKHGAAAANALFVVIDERRRKRRTTILATTWPLHRWDQVIDHPDLAATIAGWMCERGCLLEMDSPLLPAQDPESVAPRSREWDDRTGTSDKAQAPIAAPQASSDAHLQARPESSSGASNQRVWPRAEVAVEVGIATESNFYIGFSADISEGGVFVATYAPLTIGSHVSLVLSLPGAGDEVRVNCRVCWLRTYNASSDAAPGMGLLFLDLGEKEAASIRRFVASRDPIFWE